MNKKIVTKSSTESNNGILLSVLLLLSVCHAVRDFSVYVHRLTECVEGSF